MARREPMSVMLCSEGMARRMLYDGGQGNRTPRCYPEGRTIRVILPERGVRMVAQVGASCASPKPRPGLLAASTILTRGFPVRPFPCPPWDRCHCRGGLFWIMRQSWHTISAMLLTLREGASHLPAVKQVENRRYPAGMAGGYYDIKCIYSSSYHSAGPPGPFPPWLP